MTPPQALSWGNILFSSYLGISKKGSTLEIHELPLPFQQKPLLWKQSVTSALISIPCVHEKYLVSFNIFCSFVMKYVDFIVYTIIVCNCVLNISKGEL